MLKRSRQMSQRITPAWALPALLGNPHVLQELVADGVVGGERSGVRRGGLRAGGAAIGFDEQKRLFG